MHAHSFTFGRARGLIQGAFDGRRHGRPAGGRPEDDGEGRRGHGRHGRGRLGRFFEHGDLRLVVLSLVAEKPRHGYEIIKAIEERVAGAYSPSPGVVYPTLTMLEELGHVTTEQSAGPRKLHSITEEGRLYLEANRISVAALMARIDEAGRARASAEAPPVLRAMENLKLALRLRLSRGALSEEQVRAVAAALDAAAVAVEQV